MTKDFRIKQTQFLLPKILLTSFAGLVANCKIVWLKNFVIRKFIKTYNVNMAEACYSDASKYESFNDFFTRKLLPEARPMAQADFICPVDGVLSESGVIDRGKLIQAKGRDYTVQSLLATKEENLFSQGYFATFYLSPKDYHRIHMPIDGTVTKTVYLPGKLFSVQPATQRSISKLFAQNERVVIYFDTPKGKMVMVLVGALIVGKIATSWHGEFKRKDHKQTLIHDLIHLKQGEEVGYFKLGSTVILLLSPDSINKSAPLLKANQEVKLFQSLG
ncbi:MAG: phosphatidylserine decarboxylase [Legionellales bacterium RIFCSPHIGHO2_12_FULL_37_14]|nr:MAG: phosphatidylserine decarboxylase [Legionellales bacterium RIFCSPHIGHO2_12_FULL_37_14]